MPLDLVPNEIVGYRFRADWYSMNVVMVKRHGANSKHAGKEYETVLAYCKDLKCAALWLYHHIIRAHGADAQASQEAIDGTVASMEALKSVVAVAEEHVLAAVKDLQAQISSLGLSQKEIVKRLGSQSDSVTGEVGSSESLDSSR